MVAVVALELAHVDAHELAHHQPEVERLEPQYFRGAREPLVREHLAIDDVVEVPLPALARRLARALAV